ncbi:hypothetical protein A3Q34_09405 [Colwellia sp. PAMC 20917]|uniref:PEP-CTERM sorting domain-containing protein n=1 Tax=Colwellia sp. PAMC 20917 TaxID=1816218 RepID=UPI000878BB10|nr:PEP-CTERM sorting domain-containing protein [Colwellia sp. PAMC 20917]AOW77052.1 hypothetical protein A3Q34_09405 [Colwellia sp. PAMC 20917]
MTNKFNKIVSALVLCGATTFASASDMQIDPTATPGGTLTSIFSSITADEIKPVSAYFDLDNNGITTGDLVFDSAFGEQFGSLNPTNSDLGFNVAPAGWTLFADYEFYGAAIVIDGLLDSDGNGYSDADLDENGVIGNILYGSTTDLDLWQNQPGNTGNADGVLDTGEELAAQFTGGYINVFLNTPYTASESSGAFDGYNGIGARTLDANTQLAMRFNVTGSSLVDVSIQIYSQLSMIIDDFLYSPGVGDVKDYIDLAGNNAFGTFSSELNGLSNSPTVNTDYVISDLQNGVINNILNTSVAYNAGTNGNVSVKTRTTTIASANLLVSVPEPGTIALFGLALIGFAGSRKRKSS